MGTLQTHTFHFLILFQAVLEKRCRTLEDEMSEMKAKVEDHQRNVNEMVMQKAQLQTESGKEGMKMCWKGIFFSSAANRFSHVYHFLTSLL